ncbi:MAG TPA: serine hydrolase domain-containing protein [Chitinophagaceae bacterium]|nr:serine hydrolase domain-containing protein [Chitinophagaceae bacterium]
MKSLMVIIFACLGVYCSGQERAGIKREAEIDRLLKALDKYRVFSGTILVVENDTVSFLKSYGKANYETGADNTIDTRFRIASLSKSFTDVAIEILEEEGLIKKSDYVSKFLRDFPNGDSITIDNLMRHRSGIKDINSLPQYDSLSYKRYTPAQVYELIKELPLEFEPGTATKYSNSGFALLAYIIEVISGKSYESFLAEKVFKPSGMHSTFIDKSGFSCRNCAMGYLAEPNTGKLIRSINWDPSIKVGSGCFTATALDVYRFFKAYYTGKLVKANYLPRNLAVPRYFQGNSPGFTSITKYFLDKNIYVVVLSNNQSRVAWTVCHKLADMITGGRTTEFDYPEIPLKKNLVKKYAGHYYSGGFNFEIKEVNGNYAMISVKEGGLKEEWKISELWPLDDSQTKFLVPLFWEIVTFEPHEKGYKPVWEPAR